MILTSAAASKHLCKGRRCSLCLQGHSLSNYQQGSDGSGLTVNGQIPGSVTDLIAQVQRLVVRNVRRQHLPDDLQPSLAQTA